MNNLPGWRFIGCGHEMHYIQYQGKAMVSRCGIFTVRSRIYEGHSTKKCQWCEKHGG